MLAIEPVEKSLSVQTYTIDPSHSQILFKVRHLGFSKVTGRFDRFKGTIRLNPQSLRTFSTETVIEASSVSTADEDRDAHLRSDDFLQVDRYPDITFTAKKVNQIKVDTFNVEGDFSLHGVTRPVTLKAAYLGEAQDPQGRERVAFEAQTRINRKDFGLTWNNILETGGLLVGEEIEIFLEIQAVLQEGA